MALNAGLSCADVPLRTYTLTHSLFVSVKFVNKCNYSTDRPVSMSVNRVVAELDLNDRRLRTGFNSRYNTPSVLIGQSG